MDQKKIDRALDKRHELTSKQNMRSVVIGADGNLRSGVAAIGVTLVVKEMGILVHEERHSYACWDADLIRVLQVQHGT